MIVVALLSALPGVLVGLAVFFLGKRFISPSIAATAACIVGFVAAVALTSPTLNWIITQSTDTQLNFDTAQAAEIMGTPALTADHISDFCFQISFLSTSPIADFEMSHQDFINWMIAEGWQPQEFNDQNGRVDLKGSNLGDAEVSVSITASVYPLRSGAGQQEHLVTRGHLVHQQEGSSVRTLIRDADSGRVYFSHAIY